MAAPAFEHATHGLRHAPASPAFDAAAETLALWAMRARTRAALRAMPADRLPDIGMTPAQARDEAGKPFWRA